METKMTKYLILALSFILLLDCAATICLYLSIKDVPLEREDYQMFKAVKIPEDAVYVDSTTVSTTTDPY